MPQPTEFIDKASGDIAINNKHKTSHKKSLKLCFKFNYNIFKSLCLILVII